MISPPHIAGTATVQTSCSRSAMVYAGQCKLIKMPGLGRIVGLSSRLVIEPSPGICRPGDGVRDDDDAMTQREHDAAVP